MIKQHFLRKLQTYMDEQIQNLKNKLKKQDIKGLALDIDETLSDSNIHWFEHMFKFHMPENFTKAEIVEKYRFVEQVPGWSTEEAFEHMEKLLHSNEFNGTIPLIKDANHIINKINKFVPIVVYVTARPGTVASGTKKWLAEHNFPEAELITRSMDIKATKTDLMDRNVWKAEILALLYPEVIGIVDDNEGLAHELEAAHYQGMLYLYAKESEEFKNHRNVVVCPTWPDVLEKMEKEYKGRR